MTISHAGGISRHTDASPWQSDALPELYAHALTASTQAAAACGELCEIFDSRGDPSAAHVFRQQALVEAELAAELIRRIGGRPLHKWPSWQHYSWFYQDSPNHGARKLIARLMSPQTALRIALDAGSRAQGFYDTLSATAEHADVRLQARDLSKAKAHQLRQLLSALAQPEACQEDDELLFAMP